MVVLTFFITDIHDYFLPFVIESKWCMIYQSPEKCDKVKGCLNSSSYSEESTNFLKQKNSQRYASVNSSSAHPPGISGAFFLIVRPGGRALVYPGAFDSLVIFTSQHCHFLSVISIIGQGR